MSQAVIKVQSPEEREYARYLIEIETRKSRIAELRSDLEELNLALSRFSIKFHATVGSLFVELDRVRLTIDEYERRIAALQKDPKVDPELVEREVSETFRARREEVETESEQNRQYEKAFETEQKRLPLDESSEAERKALFRDLAKRFHPDLGRTEEERRQRERVMQRINAAFQDDDLTALRRLAHEVEFDDPAFESRSIGEKLVWAIREVARLDEVIVSLQAEDALVRQSDTWNMWRRQAVGESVIDQLQADLTKQLSVDRDKLTTLIATYRQLLEERS